MFLAQCHRARLKSNGRVVAVKVQHKDVRHSAHLDLMLMEFGVLQCEKMFPEFKLGWLARTTRNGLYLTYIFYLYLLYGTKIYTTSYLKLFANSEN